MTNLKNASASITSRSNLLCLDWGTPDFQIPESKCALRHSSNLLGAGLGCAQHWNPLERKWWKVQHPPRHSSSRHSGAKNCSWITAHSHRAAEKLSFLASFPVPCCWLPESYHELWQLKTQSHLTISFFQSSLYLLIFNTCFPSKHLRRNLINLTVPQSLCPCKDTTSLCLPVKHCRQSTTISYP